MIGEKLRFLRDSLNLQQAEVAAKLSINKVTYNRYEQNNREPDFGTLKKLADFFNVSTDYLLGIIDDPTPYSKFRLTSLLSHSNEKHFLSEVDHAIEIDKKILTEVALQLPTLSEAEKKFILPLLQGAIKAFKDKKY